MNENSCQFIFGKKCKKYEQNLVDFVVHKTRDFDYFVFENESSKAWCNFASSLHMISEIKKKK